MRLRVGVLLPFLVLPVGVYGACSTDDVVVGPADAGKPDVVTEPPRMDANEIPCEPRAVLHTICQQCHANPPLNGAPFPLVNRSDLFALRSGSVVRDLMIEEVEAGRMPLAPVTITAADRKTLLDWLKAGAPSVSPRSCEPAGPTDAGSDADAAGDGG